MFAVYGLPVTKFRFLFNLMNDQTLLFKSRDFVAKLCDADIFCMVLPVFQIYSSNFYSIYCLQNDKIVTMI